MNLKYLLTAAALAAIAQSASARGIDKLQTEYMHLQMDKALNNNPALFDQLPPEILQHLTPEILEQLKYRDAIQGQYNSYLDGANSAIEQGSETLNTIGRGGLSPQ